MLALALMFSSVAYAEDGDFFTYSPSVHVGAGIELPTGMNQPTYGMVLVKGYLGHMGFEDIGLRVLGLGASVNADGGVGLVVSPLSYYIQRISIGPEFIIPSSNQTNFGISVSYKF